MNYPKQGGFTLLEMLVSVAIFALMSAMAYSGLNQVIRSSDAIKTNNTTLAELQFSFASLEKDFLQLSQRKVRDQYGDEQGALTLDEDNLSLSRLGWQNLLEQKRSRIQRVQYSVENNQLIRRYWFVLDKTLDSKPVSSVLLNNVESASFRLMDSKQATHKLWPFPQYLLVSDQEPPDVRALEIKIELKQWGEVIKLIELVDHVS
ncbi:MAG: type II secretion system minor pseudopilin GspJ [Gammaproteobacteria bacterium]|nr:type II secretion system minor pseudopilin GspJ [Gammaproteobacteria bacterium]